MSEAIRVLVVEDRPQILGPLLGLLGAYPQLQVVGSARSGEEALELEPRLAPQVLLCDLGLPGISGVEVIQQVKARSPEVEILVFTVFEEEQDVVSAIRAGASGYLLKGAPGSKIVEAIEEVHRGGTVIQPSLARALLHHFRIEPREERPQPVEEGSPRLTPREVEILQLIAKGLTNREAAEILSLSRSTVRTHLEHVYEKLDVTNRVEAVTEGLRIGLIET